jgi:hypothetical protein
MALSQDSEAGLSLQSAARRLRVSPEYLLECLMKAGYLYRYTGVGQPRAYVRHVRNGLFVNCPTDVLITQVGFEKTLEALRRS